MHNQIVGAFKFYGRTLRWLITVAIIGAPLAWVLSTMFPPSGTPSGAPTYADHLPEADAKLGPWWDSVSSDKRLAVIKFCAGFLALTPNEQLEVFYFNEDKTSEARRVCDWLEIHGHI